MDGADCHVVVPTITIYIDLDDWDARAKALGGNSYSLFAGVAAKLGEHLGRCRSDDGTVTLLIPFSDRTLDDTRANAMSYAKVSVDPTQRNHRLVRRPGRHQAGADNGARGARSGAADPSADPVHTEAGGATNGRYDVRLRRFRRVLFQSRRSSPRDWPSLDGTAAEYVMLRGVDQNVTRQYIESVGGQLVVVGGRLVGKMSMSVVAYQPGGKNSKPDLRELAAQHAGRVRADRRDRLAAKSIRVVGG